MIYVINCSKCGLQYIGETKRQRMYKHYRSVPNMKLHNSTPVSRHFSGNNHSAKTWCFQSCTERAMKPPQITARVVDARNYSTYGHSPPSILQAFTCLCELYCSLIAPLTQVLNLCCSWMHYLTLLLPTTATSDYYVKIELNKAEMSFGLLV